MSIIALSLHRKTLLISAQDGKFTEKLSFEARLPKQHSLSTIEGKKIKSGHVELIVENTEHETEKINFIDGSEDADTGSIYPPSISFRAKVTTGVFALIRDSSPNVRVSLTLHTEMMGAIRFNDAMGEAKVWDTSCQNPVPVESYEITLSSSENDTGERR